MFRIAKHLIPALFFTAGLTLLSPGTIPGQSLPSQADRVTVAPGARATTRLAGHLPSWATRITSDAGPVPAATPLRLTFVLTRAADRQAAFDQLLSDQQNPASPSFHHWLTPQQMGEQYGPTQHDLDALAAWLTAQSFKIVETAPSRTFITIDSTAGTVAAALGTSFRYVNLPEPSIQGAASQLKPHLTATAAPAIPTAFASLITAISGLSDVPAYPMLHMDTTQTQPGTGDAPQLNASSGSHYVTPADFAVIYDLNSVYTTYNGTGQKVAIIGRSQVNPTDITAFQGIAGQPGKLPSVVIPPAGLDPGQTGTGDQTEATLDVQRVLGTAPGAQADLVVSSNAGGGILTAMQYNVQTLLDPIMTISFGSCEALVSASTISAYDSLFSQAAAEGISVFVSSGDAGAAACDTHGAAPPSAQFLSTNYLCSSSYVTCVGGTEFADSTNPASYWSATNNQANHLSALSYIPEGAWNDPTTTDASGNFTGYIISASGGGASIYTPKPAFQTGTGVPNDGARDTPDVSFSAARHDFYFGCYAASGATCVVSPTGGYSFTGFAGTSASAPSMAAVTALLDQKLGAQGNVNPLLYRLASSTPAVFHDTTIASSGVINCSLATPSMCNNSTPSPTALTGGQPGYALTTGYDQATGLGSLDVANFISAATKAASAAATTLTVTESSFTISPGQSNTFTAILNSATAGTATGTVRFYADTTPLGAPVTLNNGVAVLSTPLTTAGTLVITAVYSGDVNFAPATAPGISLTVVGQISITKISATSSSILVNGADTFTATVTSGGTATTIPTGLIEFAQNNILVATVPLTNGQATTSSISFPSAGTIPIYAYYRGDTTYGPSASTILNITVTAPPPSYQLSATPSTLTAAAGAGTMTTININETNFAGVVNLTCAVTYNGSGTANFPPTCNLASSAITINQAPGSTTLTVATTLPHASFRRASLQMPTHGHLLDISGAIFTCFLLWIEPIRRRSSWKALAMLLLLGSTLGVLSGCSGSSTPTPTPIPVGTSVGSYTVTVTASSTVAGVAAPAPLTIPLTID